MCEIQDDEEHLALIPRINDHLTDDDCGADEDSFVEIVSTIDEEEKELIKWTDYLQINSSGDDGNNEDHASIPSTSLVQYPSSEESSSDESSTDASQLLTPSIDLINADSIINHSSTMLKKRKRRQWTIAEKLHAVAHFEKTNNKRLTAKHVGCAPKQLRMWIANKPILVEVSSRKKGELVFST